MKTEAGDGRQEGTPCQMFAGSPWGRTTRAASRPMISRGDGARRMIAAALEAEVDDYVSSFTDEVGEEGKRLVVRNGRARERRVTVGSGTVVIRAPRVNDKRVDGETGERKRFSSRILPAYARRSPKVTEVLPILYLHGLSTGDFGPALRDLLGEDASGLSSSSIQRLTETWQAEHAAFRTRELRFHRYAYLFVDGVNVSVRLGEDPKLCSLVVIGVREDDEKELLAVEDGYRESEDSWGAVFRDLRDRGLNEPKLVTGDGALGACAALRNVFPGAREQRCWVHKTANVLDALPKRLQPRAKTLLHEMAEAPTRADARKALERFRTSSTPSTPRRSPSSTRTGTRSPRSTTSRPSTGGTYERRIRSRAASRPSSSAPRSPRAPARRRPRWRWPTSCSTPPRSAGGGSTATSSSPTYSPARSSTTEFGSLTTTPRRQTRRSPPDASPSHPQPLTIARHSERPTDSWDD
jgi:transposase-like protein